MTPHTFVLVLALGAALVALWILVRFERLGPRTLVRAFVHTLVASVLLRLVPLVFGAADRHGLPAAALVVTFGVVLPVLVYAFLSGGWVARVAIATLRR